MDYYRNFDKLDCHTELNGSASGVQYYVVSDLYNEPVSLEFFKEHARIDFDTDDTLATAYISAARIHLEQKSQLSFGIKTIGLTALNLPKNYKLMYGPVNEITTEGYTNVGDIFKEGGKDVDLEFITKGINSDLVRVAICRYAAGLYISRENVIDTKFSAQQLQDEAWTMIKPIANITFL
jgi:hypothetical protein